MTRYARRKDNTQAGVEKALQTVGWKIFDFSRVGWGIPDLIARRAGYKLWIEVKSPGEGLTRSELRFHAICPGDVIVATSGAEAVAMAERSYKYYQDYYRERNHVG